MLYSVGNPWDEFIFFADLSIEGSVGEEAIIDLSDVCTNRT